MKPDPILDRDTRVKFLTERLTETRAALADLARSEKSLLDRQSFLEKEIRALRNGPEIQLELGLRN